MFRIITSSGQSLDLKPNWEIEIDIENPIFITDRIPVAFSTSILLPPSRSNCSILGYLAALKMPPAVKTLDVTLLVAQQTLFTGRLDYEGITEDGDIEYNFTEKAADGVFSQKISDFIEPLNKYYPLLLKADATGNSIFDGDGDSVAAGAKYYNYDKSEIPAVLVTDILSAAGITIATRNAFNRIAVLIGTTDMTVSEFLQNLCKMYCCSIIRLNGGYAIIGNEEALTEDQYYSDYQKKVSDIFSAKNQKPQGYIFKYANDRLGRAEDDVSRDHLDEVISFISSNANKYYAALYHLLEDGLGYLINPEYAEIVSIKSHTVNITYTDGYTEYATEFLADIIGHYQEETVNTEGDGGQFDSSTGFKLPECAPVDRMKPTIRTIAGTTSHSPNRQYVIAPRVPSSGVDGVFVGTLIAPQSSDQHYQLIDKIFYGEGTTFKENASSLDAVKIYKYYHKAFAEWLNTARQTIEADVLLTPGEINNLRIDQKVAFSHKLWFIKKLSINISTSSEAITTRGEFMAI